MHADTYRKASPSPVAYTYAIFMCTYIHTCMHTYMQTPIEKPRQALSRTYATAIAGEMISMGFEPATRVFNLEFKPDVTIISPTEIYREYMYPHAYAACACAFACVYVIGVRTHNTRVWA